MIPADDMPYRKLQKHLNRQPIGFPPSRTGADIRLLKHIFSPDEARVATCLSHILEPLDIIYRRAEPLVTNRDALETCLASMVKKGGIEIKKHNQQTDRKETCMAIGSIAHTVIEMGIGRQISREEAIQIIRENQKDGLVLQHIETCVGCGMCVKQCQTNAITLKTVEEQRSKAVINPHRCIGCGHCVTSCAVNALTLMPRKNQVQPPENRDALNAILLKERLLWGRKRYIGPFPL